VTTEDNHGEKIYLRKYFISVDFMVIFIPVKILDEKITIVII